MTFIFKMNLTNIVFYDLTTVVKSFYTISVTEYIYIYVTLSLVYLISAITLFVELHIYYSLTQIVVIQDIFIASTWFRFIRTQQSSSHKSHEVLWIVFTSSFIWLQIKASLMQYLLSIWQTLKINVFNWTDSINSILIIF